MILPKDKCHMVLTGLKMHAGKAVGERACGVTVSCYKADAHPNATCMIAPLCSRGVLGHVTLAWKFSSPFKCHLLWDRCFN